MINITALKKICIQEIPVLVNVSLERGRVPSQKDSTSCFFISIGVMLLFIVFVIHIIIIVWKYFLNVSILQISVNGLFTDLRRTPKHIF